MSKLSKFRETFLNDFTEYLLQVPLFIMTAIMYSLFFRSSDKSIIETFVDVAISNNKLIKQLWMYLILTVLLFIITTVILTMLSVMWHWVKERVKNRNINIMVGNIQRIITQDEIPKETNKFLSLIEANIKYGSPLFFKRAGSTCANVGSVVISMIFIMTILWKFPHWFDLSEADKKAIEAITCAQIISYWGVMSLFFMIMIAVKSGFSVYIEEPIKNRRSDTRI